MVYYSSSERSESRSPSSSSRAKRGDLNKEIASSQAPRNDGSARTISDKKLYFLVEQTLDRKNPRAWYYALLDYGSYLGKNPHAFGENPNRKSKHYTKQSRFEGSLRQVRGEILRRLLKEKELTVEVLGKGLSKQLFQEAFRQLEKEGFLTRKERTVLLKS